MTRTAALYCRISDDRTGQAAGVRRQEADCREVAARRGWTVGRVYTDNDLSAFSGRMRPAYSELLDDVKAGMVGAVVAWHPDRLYRRMRDLEQFIEVVEAAGAEVVTARAGDIDLSTPSGRMVARQLGVAAQYESEHKAERLQRKHEEIAAAGRWKGGPRPFGYRPDGDGGLTIVAEEAATIREAARRVLAGETVYGVCADLNRRGVATVKGTGWRTPTLRRILTAPTTAGMREHLGEVVGRAVWEPILDEPVRQRLDAMLNDPSRTRERPRRAYLLTGGVARCGRCGGPLFAQRRTTGARVYACTPGPDKGGCGALTCQADPLEGLVIEALLQRLDTPALAEALGEEDAGDSAGSELAEIESRLVDLADMFAAGEIGRAEWLRARKTLETRQSAARAILRRDQRAGALEAFAGSDGALRAAWPTMTLDQRRAVVAAVIDRVTVLPAARRGRIFDPGRVDVTWRV